MIDGQELLKRAKELDASCVRSRDYAKRLAVSMHCKFYPENESWQPLDDVMGLLTQIDNMVTGLSRIVPPRPMTESEREHQEKLMEWFKASDEYFGMAMQGELNRKYQEYLDKKGGG